MPVAGSRSLGGATVTAGGLVFFAGTEDEKIRAFDTDTGKEFWSTKLPFALAAEIREGFRYAREGIPCGTKRHWHALWITMSTQKNAKRGSVNSRTKNQNDKKKFKPPFPRQKQRAPGLESRLDPQPAYQAIKYRSANKLEGKVALITGGDSGIGRAVAYLYAREGADVAINFLPQERSDAEMTRMAVEAMGRQCLLLPGNLTVRKTPADLIKRTLREFGRLDILVSNAAHQNHKESILQLSEKELYQTYETNLFACIRLIQAALPHLAPGSSILITSSETGLLGSRGLQDYASTKGALNALVKTLAEELIEKGIRINAIAPGPVWTPLNPSDRGRTRQEVSEFGKKTPLKRPAQPEELSPAYVFLASEADSSYITGIVLPIMGGTTVGS